MKTIYTFNTKVLKNSANDKWLIKAVPPPSFDEVTIGTQTWKAKNLDIDDGGEGIYIVENVTANGVNFGTQYYYTWNAAVRVASSIEGWHLPTQAELNTLAYTAGGSTFGAVSVAGTKLKSTSGWNDNANGDGTYDFDAFPVGYIDDGSVNEAGSYAGFWTSSEDGSDMAYYGMFSTGDACNIGSYFKSSFNSVRLIKDS